MGNLKPDQKKGCEVAHSLIRLAIEKERKTHEMLRKLAEQTKESK